MTPNIIFLGWDKPWTSLFAAWLEQEPDRLRHRLVVTPTRESGRRLRECLVSNAAQNGTAAILGPRVATPDDFVRPEIAMPDAIRWAGWLAILRATKNDKLATLFPTGVEDKTDSWRLAVVRQIEQARELLVSVNANFATVAQQLSEDNARWVELSELERAVIALWKKWDFTDPAESKRQRAQTPVCPQGVDEIIVAGVTDPTWLAVEVWRRLGEQKIPITVLVGAPAELKGTFDEWGRPKTEYWADRKQATTPEPSVTRVAADAVALAEAVVRACAGRSNRDVAVGVCDATFIPAVAGRFQAAGWLTFNPEGVLLAQDGWPELLEALAVAVELPDDYAAIARTARHPVVWADWLKDYGAKASLVALEKWEDKNSITNAITTIERLRVSQHDAEKSAGELLAKVHHLVQFAAGGATELFEDQLRQWFKASVPEVANHALAEMGTWQQLQSAGFGLALRLNWLAKSLAGVSRQSDSADAVLALQGWLELPFDPAPHLILAGLHEGSVPEAPPADPLITEVVREKLGIRDRKSRLAREIFLYSAMAEGRRVSGSVTVLTAQVNAQGEPCQPSRVLLQAQLENLPARVLKFIKGKPDVPLQHTPSAVRGNWQLRPLANTPANKQWDHVSPSALKTYLTCPTRFYFAKVLGWEKLKPFDGELSGSRFGDLIHAVLKVWGTDLAAREIADAKMLQACWRALLQQEVETRFGTTVSPLIRLQIMSAEERLMALAGKQAEQYQLGWRVVAVEKELNGVLTLAGLPVHMTVDRIDRHTDGRMRVIDYKTGKEVKDPRKAHLRAWSEEKYPMPLAPVLVVKGTGKAKDKSHIWTDLQLPLYVATVQKAWNLDAMPEAFYALLPAAVGDTEFVPFEELGEMIPNAIEWAEKATHRILDGVFWPPAPDVKKKARRSGCTRAGRAGDGVAR